MELAYHNPAGRPGHRRRGPGTATPDPLAVSDTGDGTSAVLPTSSVPPIDLAQALDDLAGDKTLLEDIVAQFLADAPVSIDQLQSYTFPG